MIRVRVEGLDKTLAGLANAQKQARFAAAVALTRTARAVKDEMPAVMERELDRPTAFSKRGMFVTPATRDKLQAVVGFMDRQAGYLKYQIEGGVRAPRSHGIKLPGNVVLNAFGNIPKGLINQLKKSAQDGTLSKTIGRRLGLGNRRKGAAPLQLFYGKPTGRGWEKAPAGIWRRVPGTPGKLVPVIVFEDTPARYRPRFRFAATAEKVVQREWSRQFAKAFDEAMRSAR